MFGWIKGALTLVRKVGKVENAVQQTRDVFLKVQSFVQKYQDVDDDAKALWQEVQEAKDAWAEVL